MELSDSYSVFFFGSLLWRCRVDASTQYKKEKVVPVVTSYSHFGHSCLRVVGALSINNFAALYTGAVLR